MPLRRNRPLTEAYEQEFEQRVMARMEERLDQFGDYGVAGDDYKGAPVFNDAYEEALVFDDDQFEEESMPVYDTDIEDVIKEEEGFVRKRGFGDTNMDATSTRDE
ncbi:hypothetical protein Tco_0518968 [Tanacetum coccineum]